MAAAPASGIVGGKGGAPANRLDTLDGLRGIAALLVVIYHFTSRWTVAENGESLYPYGDGLLTAFPWLSHLGTFGVSLFFLISGFVMIMTLQRSSGLLDFAVRRAARLWPVMLLCATLTTALIMGSGIHQRFDSIALWEITPTEYVSSIFFVDPAFVGDLTHTGPLQWVDGVYWTLWIEVRFYALVALVYWMSSGRGGFIWGWLFVQAMSLFLLFSIDYTGLRPHWTLNLVLQPYYLGFFSLGICAWFYWSRRNPIAVAVLAILSVISLLLSAVSTSLHGPEVDAWYHIRLDLFVFALFGLFVFFPGALKFLEQKWAIALGLASYPLYMFHERLGVVAMTLMDDLGIPPALILISALSGVIAIAFAIHRFAEMPAKDALLSAGLPIARKLENRWPVLRFRGGGRPQVSEVPDLSRREPRR